MYSPLNDFSFFSEAREQHSNKGLLLALVLSGRGSRYPEMNRSEFLLRWIDDCCHFMPFLCIWYIASVKDVFWAKNPQWDQNRWIKPTENLCRIHRKLS